MRKANTWMKTSERLSDENWWFIQRCGEKTGLTAESFAFFSLLLVSIIYLYFTPNLSASKRQKFQFQFVKSRRNGNLNLIAFELQISIKPFVRTWASLKACRGKWTSTALAIRRRFVSIQLMDFPPRGFFTRQTRWHERKNIFHSGA